MPPFTIVTLLLIIPASISKSAKSSARPVHEIINEQARIDEKKLTTPGFLPYGNPLAGNSQQNARLHAQNQQAMFNAERVRQHRAQLQRWTKAPIQMDSYMKAYHESQESHQLALEQQQAKQSDAIFVATTPKSRRQEKRVEAKRVERIRLQSPEPTKITKADAVIKERSRNHRSHGSLDLHYQQYLQPKRYQTVYVSPGPTYDQGVTIKPNGNVGLKHYQPTHETKLYTEAIPSTVKPIFPKQYYQMQEYQSAQDIDALKSLLKTNSKDQQLSGLNALIVSGNQNKEEEEKHKNLETPIDLYFYLKDAPNPSLPQQFDHTKYAQIPQYASAYMPDPIVKDHTPITEQVDDIEDPNKHQRGKIYGVQPVVTPAPATQDTTTTKSNNYYKVEVASQVISSGHSHSEPDYYVNEDPAKPSYQTLQYAQPQYPPSQYGTQYGTQYGDESDQSEIHLHHNAQHTGGGGGVQHLTGDGTGVSAYGDDSVSNKPIESLKRKSRSTLETSPFLVPQPTNSSLTVTNDTAPKAESLVRLNRIGRHRINDVSTFVLTPKFPIGEATDYTYNDYEDHIRPHRPNRQNQRDYDEDYEYDDDFDYDYEQSNKDTLYGLPTQNYAPTVAYNTNPNKYRKRFPEVQYGVPETSYGTPLSFDTSSSYGAPVYGPPNYNPTPSLTHPRGHKTHELSEPLYILSQSQLKNLIGHHNLNIQHLDIFQTASPKMKRKRPTGHRKYKRRYPDSHRHAKIQKTLHKLHKITGH